MNFAEAHTYFTDLIESDQNFALVRYVDGELALMRNQGVGRQTQAFNEDRWDAPAKPTRLGEDLIRGLSHTESNYYYGIPGKNDCQESYEYLSSLIPKENITYAALFVNANYQKTKDFFKNLKKPVNLLANESGNPDGLPFEVESFCSFPDDCVNWWEERADSFLQLMRSWVLAAENETFFVAAGPVSEVIIDEMYKANPNNQYIDVGSALDELFYGRQTRPYMNSSSQYAAQVSTF